MLMILLWIGKSTQILKLLNLKLVIDSGSQKGQKAFLANATEKISQKNHFLLILVSKLIHGRIKSKKQIIGSCYEKEFLLTKLLMSFCQESNFHVKDNVNLVLYLLSYTTKQCYRCWYI